MVETIFFSAVIYTVIALLFTLILASPGSPAMDWEDTKLFGFALFWPITILVTIIYLGRHVIRHYIDLFRE